jgi:hypothetical protein
VRSEARFYLLFTDQPTGFDLMAECALCGAMSERPLVVAWETRHVPCSNCGVVMRMDADVLARLREQALAALATIDRLRTS